MYGPEGSDIRKSAFEKGRGLQGEMLAVGTVATGTREEGVPAEPVALTALRGSLDGFRLAVGAITAGLGAFLLLRLHALPPHEDETLAFFVSRRPLGEVLETVLGERGGAPLHYLLAHAAGRIDPGLTSLRLISVAFAVASMPVVAALVARLADRRTAVVATLVTAVSWTLLYHAIYARMYSLFLFASMLSLLLLLRALERSTRGRWAAWAASTLALLATQPYGVLVLAAEVGYVALLWRRRPFPLRPPLIALAAVVVLAGPLWRTYFVLASRFEVGLGTGGGSQLGSPLDVLDYLWEVLGDFAAPWWLVAVPVVVVAALGLVVLARRRPDAALLSGALLVVPIVALVAARSGAGAALETRHLIFLLPFFGMAFAAGLWRLGDAAGRASPVVVAGQVARLGTDHGRHFGPELLAVPSHLLQHGRGNRIAAPVLRIIGLVDQVMSDDRAVPHVRREIHPAEAVDPSLPHRQAEMPVLLVVLLAAGEHEHYLAAPSLDGP